MKAWFVPPTVIPIAIGLAVAVLALLPVFS